MGVDRVGLALPAAGLAVGLLALDDGQAGGSDRTGQSDTEAARALDRHDHPRPGRMVEDPGQQLGKAGVVIADLSCPDRSAGRERDLHLVGVAVGVDTDDGVDEFCQHGHRPSPSCREWVNVGTGLGEGHRVAHL